jgi:hypothetical protein
MRANRVREFLGELRPALERVAVPRDELAAVPTHDRQGAESIQLGLEDKVGVIERLRNAKEPHGCDRGHGKDRLDPTKRALDQPVLVARHLVSAVRTGLLEWTTGPRSSHIATAVSTKRITAKRTT